MYLPMQTLLLRLATKRTKKQIEENANVSFFKLTIKRALVLLRSVIH